MNIQNLREKINETISAFTAELDKNVINGNKSAGTRARKLSLELERQLKQYRKTSIESDKNSNATDEDKD